MITKVVLPKLGQTMEEGTIVSWLVSEGDEVKRGDIILEVETDKAVIEVESPGSGVMRKILRAKDEVVPVLEVIAVIADAEEDIAEALAEAAAGAQPQAAEPEAPKQAEAPAVQEQPEPQAAPKAASRRVAATPRAKRIAKKKGIDLSLVTGTGPGGRITETDVSAFADTAPQADTGAVEMTPMRRAIAKAMTLSKQSVPHFYLTIDVDATALHQTYTELKASRKVSLNDFIVKAVAVALPAFPEINSRIEAESQILIAEVNIGIAVSIDDGLVVPVLEGAQSMTLGQISERTREIVEQARKGKTVGVGKGTFTISNLGMFGISDFAAIINPPEVAILAVGAAKESVLVRDGATAVGRIMNLTLSGDHRAFDGVTGAKFLAKLKDLLETPGQLTAQ